MQKIMLKCNGKYYNKKLPKDYVIATGKAYSVREFINICCKYLKLNIRWEGKGLNTRAYIVNGKKRIIIKS